MADFSSVVNSIPPVTRTLLISIALVTGPCLLGIVSAYDVALLWPKATKSLQIWRLYTAFFMAGGGFPLIFDMFLIYRNSSALEMERASTAEYAWMHLVLAATVMVFNLFPQHPFLFRPLVHAQTYVWARANPTMKITLFGLITIPTSLYPPALVVLDLITGGPGKAIGGLMGLFAGHVWWFCSVYLPIYAPTHLKRQNPLGMPYKFQRLFAATPTSTRSSRGYAVTRPSTSSPRNPTGSAGASSATRSAAAEAVRHRWGSGNRLGGDKL